MSTPVTIYVCTTCRRPDDPEGGPRGGATLAAALAAYEFEAGAEVQVVPVECLSVCKRPITIGFSAPGKWTYVYGDFGPEAAEDILAAAAQYAGTSDGLIPWRERPDALKRGVVARLPPFPPASEAAE